MLGDVRRSTTRHGGLGRCEIREEFRETSELYLEQSLQPQNQSRPGLHNQNKCSDAIKLRFVQRRWGCAPARKRDLADFQKRHRAREIWANLAAPRQGNWEVSRSVRRYARLPTRKVVDAETLNTQLHNPPSKSRRWLDWHGLQPLDNAFPRREKTPAAENPRIALCHHGR